MKKQLQKMFNHHKFLIFRRDLPQDASNEIFCSKVCGPIVFEKWRGKNDEKIRKNGKITEST